MSDDRDTTHDSAASRRPPPPTGPRGPGGPMGAMGMPAEKSMNFGPSARRLIRRLRPERMLLSLVFLLAVVSVTFSVLGPDRKSVV